MKIDKWISQTIYVDQQTGEILNGYQVKTEYVIIKKTKYTKYESSINRQTKNIETTGIIEYTAQCTRNGKQIKLDM